jgi:hypothetical protein
VKNPFFFAVLGVERTFFEYLNVNLQYFTRYIRHHQDPDDIPDPAIRGVAIQQAVINNQLDRTQHGSTLRVSNKWFNETPEGEIAAVYTLNRTNSSAVQASRSSDGFATTQRSTRSSGGF